MLHHKMRLIAKNEQTIRRAITALLMVGILGRIWTVAVYPPFGNAKAFILLLGAAILLTAACNAADAVYSRRLSVLYERLAPVIPIVAVSVLLTLWAAAVYMYTDTLALLRLGHFTMGIGLIVVVWFSVDRPFRLKLLLGVVVLGAAICALYGVAVTLLGDPFMTVWVILSKVDIDRIPGIVAGGRMVGLSQNIIAFSYILAAAVPLAFAFLMSGSRLRTKARTWSWRAVLWCALALMLTVVLLNATRSAILGVVVGCVVTGVILFVGKPELWKRMSAALAVIIVWLLLMFVPGVKGAETILASGPTPSIGNETGGLEDKWYGRALVRLSQPGWPSDQNSPYEVELRNKIETARELWRESRADFGLNRRIISLDDTSARARIPMALTALRYSLEHPLGTGRYLPEDHHLPVGLEPRVAEEVLRTTPHNQFLVVLVYYGYPGLALLVAFYLLVGRSLLTTYRRILRSRDIESLVLAAAVTGSLAGYGINSLFHNAGPFVGDWFHFVLVGLVFCIERLTAERGATSNAPAARE